MDGPKSCFSKSVLVDIWLIYKLFNLKFEELRKIILQDAILVWLLEKIWHHFVDNPWRQTGCFFLLLRTIIPAQIEKFSSEPSHIWSRLPHFKQKIFIFRSIKWIKCDYKVMVHQNEFSMTPEKGDYNPSRLKSTYWSNNWDIWDIF